MIGWLPSEQRPAVDQTTSLEKKRKGMRTDAVPDPVAGLQPEVTRKI